MSDEFTSRWWTIELASGWSAKSEESCSSITAEVGVGALQISAYGCTGGPVTEGTCMSLLKGEYPAGVEVLNHNFGQFSGLNVSFSVEKVYWRKWSLRNGSLLLFVTYNCDTEEKDIERSAVDQMLATLKPIPLYEQQRRP